MKYRKLIAALVTAALSSTMGIAHAADNHTITVNATVAGNCKFNTGTSTVALTLDASQTTVVTGNANILYRCTKTTLPAFTYASASTGGTSGGNLSAGGADLIAYTFTNPASGPAGTGLSSAAANDKTLTVTVSVDQTNAQNVTPGTYTDTIAVTVNP